MVDEDGISAFHEREGDFSSQPPRRAGDQGYRHLPFPRVAAESFFIAVVIGFFMRRIPVSACPAQLNYLQGIH
jgi:hypothetical protein